VRQRRDSVAIDLSSHQSCSSRGRSADSALETLEEETRSHLVAGMERRDEEEMLRMTDPASMRLASRRCCSCCSCSSLLALRRSILRL